MALACVLVPRCRAARCPMSERRRTRHGVGGRPGDIARPRHVGPSAHVEREVVEHERRLVLVILSAGELERNVLAGVRREAEAVLRVSGVWSRSEYVCSVVNTVPEVLSSWTVSLS